ncbi:hypothetical protein WKW80_11405 [Variovorax humicola]|uniref:Uncharacterized protein n=1 Tax=Variovorax humicola TaxID=1769758 RepID=A0ABU8VZJ6_9BURK
MRPDQFVAWAGDAATQDEARGLVSMASGH